MAFNLRAFYICCALVVGASGSLAAANPFLHAGEVSTNEVVPVASGRAVQSWLPDFLVAWQRDLNETLAVSINELKESGAGTTFFLIVALSFLYGILHAVGPGHGKAVFAAWALAGERSRRQAVMLPFGAAYLHAGSALVLVAVSWFFLERLAGGSDQAERILVIVAAIVLFALALREFVQVGMRRFGRELPVFGSNAGKTSFGLMLSVGLVPCPISSILLVFSFAAGLVWQGIVFVFAFATGMGLTMMVAALCARFVRLRVEGRTHPLWRFLVATGLPVMGGIFFVIAGLMMLAMYC